MRPHGVRAKYTREGCRCAQCREASRVYELRRRRDRAYGITSLVDAGPAREHVNRLRAAGMGYKQVAAAASLSVSTVGRLLFGGPAIGLGSTKRIRPETANALLAVTLEVAPGRDVPATGTARRLQALVWNGWSMSSLARLLGWNASNLIVVVSGRQAQVTAATAREVADLFEDLWNVEPYGLAQTMARARNHARRRGWAPAAAWEDIDDPNDRPRGVAESA